MCKKKDLTTAEKQKITKGMSTLEILKKLCRDH